MDSTKFNLLKHKVRIASEWVVAPVANCICTLGNFGDIYY